MRIGIGYDIHRLASGRKMILGGVHIPYDKGPLGHSDGDVLLHAVCDAILGAMGEGDIGMLFPDTDPSFKDVSSKDFLYKVVEILEHNNLKVQNIDCVIILEDPKIASYKESIRKVISEILKIPKTDVNLKGKTSEGMGEIGKGEAVAAYVVALLG